MQNDKMLREAPVWKLVCGMSLPMILIMLVQVLYNMADVFFMGRSGSYMQVAAISLAGPVFSVISAFNTLIGFGGCTAISMALGREDRQKVKQYSAFTLWAGLAVGAVVSAAILLGLKPLVTLLGADAETAGFTMSYLRIVTIGAPISIANGALGNAVRADGESKGPVVVMMLGTITNIILDPILIQVLGMGIRGAAIATVTGNVITFICLLRMLRNHTYFSISLKDLAPGSWRILGYGVPMAAGTLLMSLSAVFSNRILVTFGNNAVAAQGVAGKAGMLISMIIMGICMGVQPAVSFNYGAGNNQRVHRIVRGVGIFSTIFGAAMAVGIFLIRGSFVGAFLDDPSVTGLATRMVTASLIGAPFFGIYQIASVYLQGTGKVSYATVTSLLRQGIILVPVLLIMTSSFGLTGFIYSAAIADLISTAISVALSFKWKRSQEGQIKKPLPQKAAARA